MLLIDATRDIENYLRIPTDSVNSQKVSFVPISIVSKHGKDLLDFKIVLVLLFETADEH